MMPKPSTRPLAPYRSVIAAVAVAACLLLGAGLFALAPHAGGPSADLRPASGASEQWAFGGIASESYSCSLASCFANVTVPNVTSFSLSAQFYVEWAVIYSLTNVSAGQQMMEVATAANGSASIQLSECLVLAAGQPCTSDSFSLRAVGLYSATGFSNVTVGTVNLSSGGAAGSNGSSVPALALENAQSTAAFNVSYTETYSTNSPNAGGVSSGQLSFVAGGNESSSIRFAQPLGIVPVAPQPGETWNASAPFSASGTYHDGEQASVAYGGGVPISAGNWSTLQVSPSGTLSANGTDLGATTLVDNYTSPPTSVTAQLIEVDFGSGNFSASDGWLMSPTGVYGGLDALLGGSGSVPPVLTSAPHRSTAPLPTSSGAESAYYQTGTGFVGAEVSLNLSGTTGTTGGSPVPSGGSMRAGPEPVSVAESQYRAILAGPGSGATGFASYWVLAAIAVVVVALAVGIALVVRRRRPPAAASAGGPAAIGGPGAAAPVGPAPPGGAPPGTASTTPVCPACGEPAMFVADYQRYYCPRDQRYL